MNLRTKTSLLIFTLVIFSILLNALIFTFFVKDGFGDLEKQEAINDIKRCKATLNSEGNHLVKFVHDWAAWDDTYQFVEDRNQEYVDSNLVWETFRDNKINLVLIYSQRGEKIWGKIYDIEKQVEINLQEFSGKYLPTEYILFNHKNDVGGGIYGTLKTEYGILLLASSQILKSDNTGPHRGSIMMGRFLNDEAMKSISNQVGVKCELLPVETDTGETIKFHDNLKLIDDNPIKINDLDDNWLYLYLNILDPLQYPISILKATVHKDITLSGDKTISYLTAAIALVGLVMMLAIIVMLRILVGNPTRELTRQICRIAEKEDFSMNKMEYRNDEIGRLAKEFASMMEKLSKAQEKLLEQSYQSGMAETIINSLHTIRNTLFPINTSVETIDENLREISIDNIRKAFAQLESEDTTLERREKLVEYLTENLKTFISICELWEEEKGVISKNLQRIDEILMSHEHISKLEKISQDLNLEKLVEEILSAGLFNEDDFSIEMTDEFRNISNVHGEKIKITQIMKSILFNMIYTMQKADATPHIVIDGRTYENRDKKFVVINLIDSLSNYELEDIVKLHSMDDIVAMEKEKLPNLHWVSNTLSAMGGGITFDRIMEDKGLIIAINLPLVAPGAEE